MENLNMGKYNTLKDWLYGEFDAETLSDMATHGCIGGFPSLSYYRDTCAIYENWQNEIWERLDDLATSIGQDNVLQLLGQCNAPSPGNDDQFRNLCVWVVCEEYARERTEEVSV